jgi:SecD/SecF fusion protein
MGSRRLNLFVILFVIGLLVASGVAILSKETVLGIDLRGGTQLGYEAQPTPQVPEPTGEDVDRAIEIIRDRVDSLGVSEPEISRLGPLGIQVSLPDVQDAARAAEQVGDTAQLYFYDLAPNIIPLPGSGLTSEELNANNIEQQTAPRLYDAVKLASEQPDTCNNECTVTDDRYYLFNKDTKEPVAGPESTKADLFLEPAAQDLPKDQQEILTVKPGTIVVRDSLTSGDDTAAEGVPAVDRYFVLRYRPALSGSDLRNPEQATDPQTSAPNVTFDFTDEGGQAFQEITKNIADRGLENFPPTSEAFAIVLDDELISRPSVDPEEFGGIGIDPANGAQISGGFDLTEAQELAEFLRIGALPVELQLISSNTVSATLGEQALDEALKAGIVGLILVILFLIAFYRFLGLIATLGLLVYAAFFFALMKMIPITLTLPGIAGLILTIGVAADSNIVIFERIKEEARKGHSMVSAISVGYRKGIGSIIDANVITLLTAFVLFGLATGGVKGFAFTLGIGVIVSLFTAVVFTRAVLATLGRTKVLSNPKLMGVGEDRVRWHFDFAGMSKWFFSLSGAILAIGAIAFATQGLNLGIDFESGTRIKVALAEPGEVEAVRESLVEAGVTEAESAKIQAVTEPAFGDNVVQIQGKIDPEQVGAVQEQLEADFGLQSQPTEEAEAGTTAPAAGGFDSTSVGPTFGAQVAKSAAYAIIFSLLLISAYVAFRFEAKYAIPVLIAVFHDILITGGVYALSGREVSSATVAAFLTILGYSLYDCVIVFDRVRENVPRLPRATFAQIANRSLSEVLTRSLITGLSTVFLIGVILVFGGETLQDFAFAMMIGLISGTYSSIFIATPVLIAWKSREPGYRARAARIKELMGMVPPFPEDNVVAKIDGEEVGPEVVEGPDEDIPDEALDSIADPESRAASSAATTATAPPAAEVSEPDDDANLSPEELAERERKREIRRQRKERRAARQRKHGRPR